MAILQVTSDAEFASAIASATGLDTVELANGAAFTTLTIPNTAADGVTVAAQTTHSHTIQRLVIGDVGGGVQGVTLQGLNIQLVDTDYHPELSQKKSPLIGTGHGALNGLEIRSCKVRVGDHLNSMAAWDTANTGGKYAELFGDGATANWDVAGGGFNMFYSMPDLINLSSLNGSVLIEDCDLEDSLRGIVITSVGGYPLIINKNRMRRMYGDSVTIGFTGAFAAIPLLDVTANHYFDVGWCQPQDNGNPHGDAIIQAFSTDTGGPGDSTTRIENGLCAGNVLEYSAGCRGQVQRIFLSDTPLGYPHTGWIIKENWAISRISSVGIGLSNADNSAGLNARGSAFNLIEGNTLLTRPNKNTPVQNELFTNPHTGVPAASPSAAVIAVQNEPSFPGQSLVKNNFVEAITLNQSIKAVGNVVTGRANAGSSYNAFLASPPANDAEWDTLSGDALFQALRCSTPGVGAVEAGMTIQDLIDRWGGSSKPYDTVSSWLGFPTLRNQAFATKVSSGWILAQCGRQMREMSVGPGVTYRTNSIPSATGASAETSDTAPIAHGTWIEFFVTTGNGSAITTVGAVTLGGETFEWRAKTLDLVQYPHSVWPSPADAIWRQTAAQAIGTAESKMLTGLVEFQFPAGNPAISQTFLNRSAGTTDVSISVLTTGKLRLVLRNNAGTVIAQCDSNTDVADGTMKRAMFSIDTALTNDTDALKLYINDVLDQTGTTVTQDALIDLDDGTASQQVGGAASTPSFVCDALGPIVLWPGVWIDLSDDAQRERFSPSNAGPNFEALTGTSPRIALCGTAAQINAGQWNVGSGNEFTKLVGTDLVAFDAHVWPPVLTLAVSVVTVGPYYVGQPIQIVVLPSGYAKSGVNLTTSADLTGAWDDNTKVLPAGFDGQTFTFTPDALGTYTFSVANDGGYTNPATFELNVVEAPTDVKMLKRAIARGIKRAIKRALWE
jgi:hypothetical protein